MWQHRLSTLVELLAENSVGGVVRLVRGNVWVLALLSVLVLMILPACLSQPPSSITAARLAQYVARVQVTCPDGSTHNGSGVVVSPAGYIATAYHLVKPLEQNPGCSMRVGFGGRLHAEVPLTHQAVLISPDPAMDLAIIAPAFVAEGQRPETPFPYAPLAVTLPGVGDTIHILGFPTISEGLLSYDTDTVLSVGSCESPDTCWLLTEAFASWGSSGGPAFNDRGEVVGIVLGQRVSVLRGFEQRLTAVRLLPPLQALLSALETRLPTPAPTLPGPSPLSQPMEVWQVEVVGPLGVNWRTTPDVKAGLDNLIAVLPSSTVLHVIPPGQWQGWWATADNRGRMGWVKERTDTTVLVRPFSTRITSRLEAGRPAIVTCLSQDPCALLVYSPGYSGPDAVVDALSGGTSVMLVEPPVWLDGLLWWHVRTDRSEGWLPEVNRDGYRLLAPVPSIPAP